MKTVTITRELAERALRCLEFCGHDARELRAALDNREGQPRTPEQVAEEYRQLHAVAPTPAEKSKLMFGGPEVLTPDAVGSKLGKAPSAETPETNLANRIYLSTYADPKTRGALATEARDTIIRLERERDEAARKHRMVIQALGLAEETLQSERAERDALKAELARAEERVSELKSDREILHQDGERWREIATSTQAERDGLRAALERIKNCEDSPDIDATGEWQFGLHCGVEDRGCTDRYEAADYGHARGVERALEWAVNEATEALAGKEPS